MGERDIARGGGGPETGDSSVEQAAHSVGALRPPLLGREQVLKDALGYAGHAVGCLAVVGERLSGRTRLAGELLERLPELGYRSVIHAEIGDPDPAMRLQHAVSDARAPYAVFLGEVSDGEALGVIARHLEAAGCLAVCTTSGVVDVPMVHVGPLDDTLAGALVELVAPGVETQWRERIVAWSDGLPGVAVSLARSASFGDDRVPDHLISLVRERLAGVRESEEDQVAALAALLGDCDIPSLAAVGGLDLSRVNRQVARLASAGVLIVGESVRYRHRLTEFVVRAVGSPRNVVSGITVPLSASSGIGALYWESRTAAAALPAERARLAEAALAGEDVGRTKRQTEHGLMEWNESHGVGIKGQLLDLAGRAHEAALEIDAAVERYRAAAGAYVEAGDADRALKMRIRERSVQSHPLHRASALDHLIEDVALGGDSEPQGLNELLGSAEAARLALWEWRFDDASRLAQTVLDHEDESPTEAVLIARFVLASRKLSTAGYVEGLSELEAVQAAANDRFPRLYRHVSSELAYWLADRGSFQQAQAVVRASSASLAGGERSADVAILQQLRAYLLAEAGEVARARQLIDRTTIDEQNRIGQDQRAYIAPYLLALEGDFEGAMRSVTGLSDDAVSVETLVWRALILGRLKALAPSDSIANLHELVRDALSRWRYLGSPWAHGMHLVSVAAEIGLVGDQFPLATMLPDGPEFGPICGGIRHYVAALGCDDPTVARSAFADAIAAFDGCGSLWLAARARLAAGQSVAGPEGGELLLAARELFASMGAFGWQALAEKQLRSRKIRWSPRKRTDPTPLSPREHEVLDLVRAGMTNAAIAEALVLSSNTVARHLTRIYSRLGVASRAEALRVVDDIIQKSDAAAGKP